MTRSRTRTAFVAAALTIASSAAPARAEEDGGGEEERRAAILASLQTDVWQPPAMTVDPLWQLLDVPETVFELAFTPAAFAVSGVERYRLDERLYDLLRNDAGTVVVTPRFKMSGGDGLGAGAKLKLQNLLGAGERFDAGALGRLNGDVELTSGLRHSMARLEGRELELTVDYELDQDIPYFGIGDDTELTDERVLSSSLFRVRAAGDVLSLGRLDFFGRSAIAFVRESLGGGTEPDTPAFDPTTDTHLMAPGGFGHTTSYVRGQVSLAADTRDTLARSTRGYLALLSLSATSSLDTDLRALRLGAEIQWYLRLLPLHRVLLLSAGSAWVTPVGGSDVPFFELVTLGRKDVLRGFSRGRFRDRFGWWGTAEYRWPIYEYKDTGVALTPALFVDVGRVSPTPADPIGTVHVDYGAGLRLAHETRFIFATEIGFSSEGHEFGFSLGKEL